MKDAAPKTCRPGKMHGGRGMITRTSDHVSGRRLYNHAGAPPQPGPGDPLGSRTETFAWSLRDTRVRKTHRSKDQNVCAGLGLPTDQRLVLQRGFWHMLGPPWSPTSSFLFKAKEEECDPIPALHPHFLPLGQLVCNGQ